MKHAIDRFFSIVCAVGLFIYLSTPIVLRFRIEPPEAFCESGPELSQERHEAVERLASGYWRSGRSLVQWSYRSGDSLPSNPPPEFAIDPGTTGESNLQDTPANRLRYWSKFRRAWLVLSRSAISKGCLHRRWTSASTGRQET